MYQDNTLSHGAWKKHKYIRKEGKKYIYKETKKHDDGTVWDKYVAEDGSAIHKQADYRYDPERPDYRKGVIDKAKEVVSKITDKENSEGEMAKGDYVDEEDKKKKYFVKHSDDSLAHSLRGSQRANHKYSARKWVNGKWRYFYGKVGSAGKKVMGAVDNARWDAEAAAYKTGEKVKETSGYNARERMYEAMRAHDAANKARNEMYFKNAKTDSEKSWNRIIDQDVKNKRDTAHGAKQIYDKTPLGKIENTAAKGKTILSNFFKNSSKTKVTVKDTFTGKTRTPKQTGNDVINIKELSEKNKKKNTNKKVKYLKDGSKVTIETSTYSRRSR